MHFQLYKVLVSALFVLALVVICAPTETESRRVIFYAPRRIKVYTGQILSARAKDKPCEKCFMRDHRGLCRRIISFNKDGC